MSIDPITLELVSEGLVAIVREMRATMLKTAYSSILKEGRDFSCALLDGKGQILAQSEDSPAHIIPLSWQVQEILKTRAEPLHPGDIVMVNDPYTGGTHLNDVALIQPVFFSGVMSFFSVVRAHWGDIGGLAPGSVAGTVDDIMHEGIRIPPLLVAEKGRLNEPLLDLLWANVRVPRDRIGDFHASISTCRTGERGLFQLAARRGEEMLIRCGAALLDATEARMRKRIAEIPAGIYRFEDYIDSNGRSETPLFLPIAISVEGSSLTADFTGASAQGPGPMNCSLAAAATGVFIACKGLLDPVGNINHGAFRPVDITAPPGCFLNVQPPAACGGFSEIRRRVTSVTIGALARAVPQYLVGDGKGTSNHVNIGSRNPATGEMAILYEYPSGGSGGFFEHDGSNACRHFDEGEFGSIQPVEVVEAENALLVERCELRVDSEGAGKRRGGLGLRRELRVLSDGAKLSILSDRNVIPPFGVLGGWGPSPNSFHVRRNGKEVEPSRVPGKVTGFDLRAGDVIVCETAGGGGYGDPLTREIELVRKDVAEGYISPQRARSLYGVVIVNGQVDARATEQLRRHGCRFGMFAKIVAVEQDRFEQGCRIVRVGGHSGEQCGLADGDLAEIVSASGAPLRVRLKRSALIDGIELGPIARDILAVRDGEQIIIRSPFTTQQGTDARAPETV